MVASKILVKTGVMVLSCSLPIPVRHLACSLPTLSLPIHVRYLAFSLTVFFAALIFSCQHYESTKSKILFLFIYWCTFTTKYFKNVLMMSNHD